MANCRHCLTNRANRARGLCWRCSLSPEIRELCPSTSKFARRSEETQRYTGEPTERTDAIPGSAAKVAVLAERASRGLGLWHPLDGPPAYRRITAARFARLAGMLRSEVA